MDEVTQVRTQSERGRTLTCYGIAGKARGRIFAALRYGSSRERPEDEPQSAIPRGKSGVPMTKTVGSLAESQRLGEGPPGRAFAHTLKSRTREKWSDRLSIAVTTQRLIRSDPLGI